MRILSLDIETTGLDTQKGNILSIGIVVADVLRQEKRLSITESYRIVLTGSFEGVCDPYALQMNQPLIKEISEVEALASPVLLKGDTFYVSRSEIYQFLWGILSRISQKGKVTLLGKNLGVFDYPYIKNTLGLDLLDFFDYKILDLGSLYFDPLKDNKVPGLKTCMRRSGIDNPVVTHDAWQDATDTLVCFANKFQLKVEKWRRPVNPVSTMRTVIAVGMKKRPVRKTPAVTTNNIGVKDGKEKEDR